MSLLLFCFNRIAFLISFLDCSLLVQRNIDFYIDFASDILYHILVIGYIKIKYFKIKESNAGTNDNRICLHRLM